MIARSRVHPLDARKVFQLIEAIHYVGTAVPMEPPIGSAGFLYCGEWVMLDEKTPRGVTQALDENGVVVRELVLA